MSTLQQYTLKSADGLDMKTAMDKLQIRRKTYGSQCPSLHTLYID